MSKATGRDKDSANAQVSLPLIAGSAAGAVFWGWLAFAALAERQDPGFKWWDVSVPGAIALVFLLVLIWAIVPRK